ncbi:hypothetical protein R4B61_00950 [Fructilactobacillus vespulae]|uniref:hypothetical protein n=1 Tax=Fructilactobacillus vespulae TaxID=1249630 RepID=UPI0039B6AEE8
MNPFNFNGNNNNDDQDNLEKNILPFLPDNYAVVINEKAELKIGKVGFSYTSLFFGVVPSIFRGDWYNFSCMIGVELFFTMLLTYVTGMNITQSAQSLGFTFQIVWGFLYNLMYFRHLQNKGFVPQNKKSAVLLKTKKFFK